MTTRSKVLLVAGALAFGTVQPASAAFVKPKIEVASAVGAGAASATSLEAFATAASSVRPGKSHTKQKKGLLHRIGRGLRALGDSQIVAAILAFAVGYLGIHRFYLGYTTIGIIQLAMGVIGFIGSLFIIGIPILIAVSIWALIDFIRILTGGLEPKGGSYSQTL